jgi:hypothetical protein
MAYGMNDVNSVANAFKGNPQALEQRYAQDQQLIDLLALQKIKSDMEAAKRQMMMKSAQQGQSPTVKQQREKEVLDMTKEDVAKRVTEVAQQRQQEEQQRMQQMMQSGLAQAPAPNMMSLAGGGIVAFAGPEGSYVREEDEEIPPPPPRVDPKTGALNPEYREWARKYYANAEAKKARENPYYAYRQREGRPGFDINPAAPEQKQPPTPAPQPDNRALLNKADAALRSQPVPMPAPTPPEALPATPKPQAEAIPTLPAMPSAAPAAPGADQGLGALQSAVQGRIAQDVGRNAAAERIAEEERVRKLYEGTQLSPEEQRDRRLKQFLLGAANRSGIGSVMAGATAGSLREQDRQRAERQEILGKSLGAGQKSFEQAETSSRQGVASGTSLINSTADRVFQEKKLVSDRQVAELNARVESAKVAATKALQATQQEQNNMYKLGVALDAVNKSIAAQSEKIMTAAKSSMAYQAAEQKLAVAKTDKERAEAQAQINRLQEQAKAEAEQATFDMRERAEILRKQQMANSGVGDFKVVSKTPAPTKK